MSTVSIPGWWLRSENGGLFVGSTVVLVNVDTGAEVVLTEYTQSKYRGCYYNEQIPEATYKLYIDGNEWLPWGGANGRRLYSVDTQTLSHAHNFDDYATGDGVTKNFPTSATYQAGTLQAYLNGQRCAMRTNFANATFGITEDTDRAGFTFASAPPNGALIEWEFIEEGVAVTDEVFNQTFTESADGSTTDFTMAIIPASASVRVYMNGQRVYPATKFPSATYRYTVSEVTKTVSFNTAPPAGAILCYDAHKA